MAKLKYDLQMFPSLTRYLLPNQNDFEILFIYQLLSNIMLLTAIITVVCKYAES